MRYLLGIVSFAMSATTLAIIPKEFPNSAEVTASGDVRWTDLGMKPHPNAPYEVLRQKWFRQPSAPLAARLVSVATLAQLEAFLPQVARMPNQSNADSLIYLQIRLLHRNHLEVTDKNWAIWKQLDTLMNSEVWDLMAETNKTWPVIVNYHLTPKGFADSAGFRLSKLRTQPPGNALDLWYCRGELTLTNARAVTPGKVPCDKKLNRIEEIISQSLIARPQDPYAQRMQFFFHLIIGDRDRCRQLATDYQTNPKAPKWLREGYRLFLEKGWHGFLRLSY